MRPEWENHVWAYDVVHCRTTNGKPFRVLVVIDEFSRECLALYVARSIRSEQVMHVLADLFLERGVLDNIRSDNVSVFIASALKKMAGKFGSSDPVYRTWQPLGERVLREF